MGSASGSNATDMWPPSMGEMNWKKFAVPDHNIVQATAVDVASLSCQRQDREVDEQLLVAVGLGSGGEAQVRALAQGQLAMPIDSDVAHLWDELEQGVHQAIHHVLLYEATYGAMELLPLDSLYYSPKCVEKGVLGSSIVRVRIWLLGNEAA
jgi:hypothetical protein